LSGAEVGKGCLLRPRMRSRRRRDYLPCLRKAPVISLPIACQSAAIPADGAFGLGRPPPRSRLAELRPKRRPDVKDLAALGVRLEAKALAARVIARGVIFILVRMVLYTLRWR
jgi:hypothetical protein